MLTCLDVLTGALKSERRLADEAKAFQGEHDSYPPVAASGRIVTSTRAGLLSAFASDGTLEWFYKHRDFLSAPAVLDNKVLVTTGDGWLLVFDLNQ